LKGRIQFENVKVGHFELGDRIYLHPNAINEAAATVRFREVDLHNCSLVDLYLYKENVQSDAIQFDLSIDERGRGPRVHEDSRVVTEPFVHWVVKTSLLDGRYDLTFRTSMAPGARSNRFAWAFIGYPVFQAESVGELTRRISTATA